MREKNRLQYGIFLIYFFLLTGLMTGCGSEKVNIVIYDGQTETKLIAKPGKTVEALLKEAEIWVDDKDVVCPNLATDITIDNMRITISRHASVLVTAEDKTVTVEMTGGKVKDALKEADIELVKNDYVNHDLNACLTDGMNLSVVHRLAVSLTADGDTGEYLTQAHTVEAFLQEHNIVLGEYDRVKPKLSGELSDGTKIVVKRVEIKEMEQVEPVSYETEVTYSASMLAGTSRIIREGENGEKRVTYRVTYVDGKEESREVIKEEILKEAVNQIVQQGSKPRKTVVSKERVDDCDGSGHGYYIITYSDGSVEYQDY